MATWVDIHQRERTCSSIRRTARANPKHLGLTAIAQLATLPPVPLVTDQSLVRTLDDTKTMLLVTRRIKADNRSNVAATADEALKKPTFTALVAHDVRMPPNVHLSDRGMDVSRPEIPRPNPKAQPGSLQRPCSASQSSSLKNLWSLAPGRNAVTIQCSLSRDQDGHNVIPQTTENTRKKICVHLRRSAVKNPSFNSTSARAPHVKVSDRGQPPPTRDLSLTEPAGPVILR